MAFEQKVPFGKTGLMVGRVGIAQGYGLPASAIEKAVHEYGVNYLYISPIMNVGKMVKAIRNLTPGNRDSLCIVLARPMFRAFRLDTYVERWLKKLGLDWTELLFQDVRKPLSEKVIDQISRLKEEGKVRFVGMSSHDRPFFGRIARGEVNVPVDFFHVRYNAVHAGAEHDIFPHLPQEDRPGIGVFTATCWRKLLKPKRLPDGEPPLTAGDCYRFVLSHPDVNVCLTAPSSAERMEENFEILASGPLDEEEMARVRRVGRHIYGG